MNKNSLHKCKLDVQTIITISLNRLDEAQVIVYIVLGENKISEIACFSLEGLRNDLYEKEPYALLKGLAISHRVV